MTPIPLNISARWESSAIAEVLVVEHCLILLVSLHEDGDLVDLLDWLVLRYCTCPEQQDGCPRLDEEGFRSVLKSP